MATCVICLQVCVPEVLPYANRSWGFSVAAIRQSRRFFGVHAAQAGVPLPRLQKLMGPASPIVTRRYMAHAPASYLSGDAALIDASINASMER